MKESDLIKWVQITIKKFGCKPNGETDYHQDYSKKEILDVYNIPRESYDSRKWFINYKLAFWQVKFPKNYIASYFTFYDKKTGLELGHNKPLTKLIGAKGQLTNWENKLKQLKDICSQTLFDVTEHPQYCFILNKIENSKQQILSYQQLVNEAKK